jgi:type I restriction enzyme R subunit
VCSTSVWPRPYAIQDVLDSGLPGAYDNGVYEQKCSALFEHIYESYPQQDAGVQAMA